MSDAEGRVGRGGVGRTIGAGGLEELEDDAAGYVGKNGVLSPFYKSILISRSSKGKSIFVARETVVPGRSADARRARALSGPQLYGGAGDLFLFSPNK